MTTDVSTRAVETRALRRALSNAAATAGQIPSIHNTQPWRWRLTDDELDLCLYHDRSLEVSDPDSRLAVLSCGAALHHALVSLAADGWHALPARLPNPGNPDHLARLRLDHRISIDPLATRYLRSIGLRHINRRSTLGTPVDADRLAFIAAAVESAGAGLHLLRPDQIYDLGLGHRGDPRISETHDHGGAFGILYAAEDSRIGWLRAGEALSAAWLTATELGVSVLQLSVTIEVAVVREHMRRLLANLGYPQLVLRFSTSDLADNAAPRPPRLPTGQVIERA